VGGDKKPVDFADSGDIGDACFTKLQELIDFSKNNDVKFIIIHLGFFDYTGDKSLILQRVATKFKELDCGQVKLCLENVPIWKNLCLKNEPLISSADDVLFFRKYFPIECTLDTDHLAITTVFKEFYDNIKAGETVTEEMISEFTSANVELFRDKISIAITEFLDKITPVTMHAVGSDFCQYFFVDKLPLIGEALPLNFVGEIKGRKVSDKIDHSVWKDRVDGFVTLELLIRDDYDYLEEIKKNYEAFGAGR
jgi:hypothetical protein